MSMEKDLDRKPINLSYTKMKGKKKYLREGRSTIWRVPALITICAFLLYGNTLYHGYVLDDDVVYLQNRYVQDGFSGVDDIITNGFLTGFNNSNDQSYRPVPLISFAIEHAIFGNNPFVGHFVNLILYAICGVIVWLVTRAFFRKYHPVIPIIMAIIFLFHPIHTEVVANIKGRDEILHFLFVISSLLFALRYSKTENRKDLIWSILLYLLALLSKEMAVTFIAIFPLTWWFYSNWNWKRRSYNSLWYVGAVSIYILMRSFILDDIAFSENLSILNNGLAAATNEAERLSTSLIILVIYIRLLFFPHPLSWDYSFNQIPISGPFDLLSIVSFLILIMLFGYAVRGVVKKDPIAWTILFFFIVISVVSNIFIMIGTTLGERFLFTPSLAFSILLVILLAKISRTNLSSKSSILNKKFITPLTIILLLFGLKTVDRNTVWESNETLFLSGIQNAPNSSRTWAALGSLKRLKGEEASQMPIRIQLYREALEYYQKSVAILDDNFDSWYNIGVTYKQLGEGGKSLEAFRKTVEVNPQYQDAWNNIGAYFININQLDSAKLNFERVLTLNPEHVEALTNVGVVFHNQGQTHMAIEWYLKAISLDPNNDHATKVLAIAYRQIGKTDEAMRYEKK